MELWIRTQDKETIMKVNRLDYALTGGEHQIRADGFEIYLATYETKERALEVLDEMQKIIGLLQKDMKGVTIGDLERLIGSFDNYVYEMPKE